MQLRHDDISFLATQGVVLPPSAVYAEHAQMALDAQPTTVTAPNAGIPWVFANVIDPETIRILVEPMKMAEILGGESKKGDFTTLTAQFPVGEATGYVKSYGDFDNGGNVGANFNWVPRQSYAFQTVQRWGERTAEMFGAAKINYAAELNTSGALVLAKFLNKTYAFGVSGLQLYGLLNDPSLSTPIPPGTKAAGGTGWANATPPEINADIQALYKKLQAQLGGNLDLDAPMTLAMSPETEVYLLNTNLYAVSVADLLKKNFPKILH